MLTGGDAMSVEANTANKALVQRFWDSYTRGDADAAAALWADDARNHGWIVGREGIRKVFNDLNSALDERVTVHEMIAYGESVACRVAMSGVYRGVPDLPVVHGGFLQGLRPIGAPYSIQQVHLFRIKNGEIAEHWANKDDVGLMQRRAPISQPIWA